NSRDLGGQSIDGPGAGQARRPLVAAEIRGGRLSLRYGIRNAALLAGDCRDLVLGPYGAGQPQPTLAIRRRSASWINSEIQRSQVVAVPDRSFCGAQPPAL